jgi:hypothetical protein
MVEADISHHHIRSRILSDVLFLFCLRIGLDKPEVRAKGINHPKYSVEAEYACLKRESARPLSNLH